MCVDSVVADAKARLADIGKISNKDTSTTPHVGREIVFEMTGKNSYKVAFLVHPDGAVDVYRNDGEAEEFGNIDNSYPEKVHEYFRHVVLEIGES